MRFFEKQTFYHEKFLPFIENALYVTALNGDTVTKTCIAKYFKQSRDLIEDCFNQAIKEGYIVKLENTRSVRGKQQPHSYCVYEPVKTDVYGTKLREYTLKNTNYDLSGSADSIKGRFSRYGSYLKAIASSDTVDEEDAEKLQRLQIENKFFTDLLDVLNFGIPTFYRTKYLCEGRKRGVNPLCHTPNPDKDHKRELPEGALEVRHTLLTDFFGGIENHAEFDTNGSIYRETYSLTHGYPLSHDVDVYHEFWTTAGFQKEFTKEIRDHLKNLCMPIYMSNGRKNKYNARLVYQNPEIVHSEDRLKCEALNFIAEHLGLEKNYPNGLYIIETLMRGMKEFLGTETFFEEDIFIYETDLHILIWEECNNRGIKTINVYDGFYFVEGTMTQELYDEIYDICTERLLKILNNPNKKEEIYA